MRLILCPIMVESMHNNPRNQRTYTEVDFDDDHPAPFRLVGIDADKQIVARQDALIDNMRGASRQQLEPIVSDEVVDFVTNGIVSRMHMREAMNSFSFSNRLHTLPLPWLAKGHSWLETIEASRDTIRGARTVRQSDMAQRAFGMASIEYKNLTMFGEFRRDLEQPMIDEMSEFMGVDVTPKAEDVYRVKLLGFSHDLLKDREIGAMRIELKRLLPGGGLDNGTIVKGRSTASINTSIQSDFDQNVIESLREAKFEAHRDDKKIELAENEEFLRYVGYLIDNQLPPGLVLARNETIYGGNARLAEKTRARDVRKRHRKAVVQTVIPAKQIKAAVHSLSQRSRGE